MTGYWSGSALETTQEPAPWDPTSVDDEIRARAGDSESYWKNYNTFLSDIESDRASAVQDIEVKVRMGSLASAQGQSAIDALNANAQQETDSFKSGPTYKYLTEEFGVIRDYAQAQYDAGAPEQPRTLQYEESFPDIGAGEWIEDGTEAGGYYADAPMDPSTFTIDTRDPFLFAGSPDELFGGLFGNATPASPTAQPKQDDRRLQGGGAQSQAVGVGNIYKWY